ncbi:hypothetical protein L218DRAFT_944888 [Marasmius fiardii PR-910]|nr:hypothetical protein L218DRAFT_944888 [Marasmius fiardii PR-910]
MSRFLGQMKQISPSSVKQPCSESRFGCVENQTPQYFAEPASANSQKEFYRMPTLSTASSIARTLAHIIKQRMSGKTCGPFKNSRPGHELSGVLNLAVCKTRRLSSQTKGIPSHRTREALADSRIGSFWRESRASGEQSCIEGWNRAADNMTVSTPSQYRRLVKNDYQSSDHDEGRMQKVNRKFHLAFCRFLFSFVGDLVPFPAWKAAKRQLRQQYDLSPVTFKSAALERLRRKKRVRAKEAWPWRSRYGSR